MKRVDPASSCSLLPPRLLMVVMDVCHASAPPQVLSTLPLLPPMLAILLHAVSDMRFVIVMLSAGDAE